jgi:hypothetical protein
LRLVLPLALAACCFVRAQSPAPSSLGITTANGAAPIRMENACSTSAAACVVLPSSHSWPMPGPHRPAWTRTSHVHRLQRGEHCSISRCKTRLSAAKLCPRVYQLHRSNGNPRLAGVLELETLRRFNFVLNQRYASLYLEPNGHVHESFEADISGVLLRASPDHKLVAAAVTPGSPAVEAHVQPGDLLVRMEDKPLTAASLGSVTAALRSQAGAMMYLDLERNGKVVRTTLRLKRML